MKKIILILFLAIGINVKSQITISVFQDVKLAFTEDVVGNKPFTLDILVLPKLFNGGNRSDSWDKQIFVYPYFEYADLSGGKYVRWAMGFGYEFCITNKIGISPSFDYGIINRWGFATFSSNIMVQTHYQISNKFSVGLLFSKTRRTDLDIYKEGQWVDNFYFGITYKIQ